jgi:hypothetical protein
MAKMEKAFFGGFREKIANVVRYSRGGKQFIRKRPVKKMASAALTWMSAVDTRYNPISALLP